VALTIEMFGHSLKISLAEDTKL